MNILGSSLSNKRIMRTALVGAALVVPAAYVTQKHVDMYPKDDKVNRKKMLNKMLGFFAGVAVSVVIAHQKISAGEYKNLKEAAKIAGIVAAPFAGLAAAKQINNQLDA